MTVRYPVRIYYWKGDYSAEAPDLPGCVAVAESVEACRKLMAEAVQLHVRAMARNGEAIPKPSKRLQFLPPETKEEVFCTWVEVKPPKRALAKS